jgi:hypothetical protein
MLSTTHRHSDCVYKVITCTWFQETKKTRYRRLSGNRLILRVLYGTID